MCRRYRQAGTRDLLRALWFEEGMDMIVDQLRVASLGNSSYMVRSQERKGCAVIDPLRDVDRYIR